ncbi:transglutaminaseTgpA domain-containing protein [Streptomyces sp. NPDC012888]|uniref:transglutaminaseTgpA domain-containing protein n=1 Tax=Streptomyces sp. NPDC012888 TaxID=3364855 RepID=UPI0036CAB4C1
MSGRARLTVFAALATLLTALSLWPLVATQQWLLQAAVLLAVQSGVGALARRVPLARPLTVAAQLLATLLLLMVLFAGEGRSVTASQGLGDQLVGGLGRLYQEGLADVAEYAIPAPLTDGIRLLLVSGVLLVGLLVDVLAVTFRTAAASGLPLLALYSVAAGLSGGGDWLLFVPAAAGYLMLLLAEGRDRLAQWGRVFGGGASGGSGSGGGRALAQVRTGRRIGAVAVLIAMGVAYVLPTPSGGLMGGTGEDGGGSGPGGGTISAVNPLVALQNSLNAQDDRPVLRYRTDNRQADQYLRIVSLDEFDGVEWKSSGRSLTDVPERLPQVPGLDDEVRRSGTEVRTSVSAAQDYVQRYLPMPYPATKVEIEGRWRFEPVGRTLIGDDLGKNKKQTVQGARYTVTSLLLRPTARRLSAAPKPPARFLEEFTRLPENLPPVVAETARQVTRGATDDYTKALKLQNWFAVKELGGFTYDTRTSSGSGSQAIARFLRDKEGFCVHFSFSMAAMARSLGIPARVAVGFTPGTGLSDGSVQVSMKDAHAWPELYFEGVGWTRFEPTPTRGTAPDYTRPEAPAPLPSAPAPLPSQSANVPAPAPSSSDDACPPEARRLGDCGAAAGADSSPTDDGVAWGPVLGVTATVLVLLALPLLPLLWRGRVRAARLGRGDPAAAWRELGDAAWDVGIVPDEALSPRGAATRIVELGALPAEPAAAVHRVAGAVERALYAPPGAPAGYPGLAADVLAARAALLAGTNRRGRLRALLLPRSAARVAWAATARWTTLTQRAATLRPHLRRG